MDFIKSGFKSLFPGKLHPMHEGMCLDNQDYDDHLRPDSITDQSNDYSEEHHVATVPIKDESAFTSARDARDTDRPSSAGTNFSSTSECRLINALTQPTTTTKAFSQPALSTPLVHTQLALPKPLPLHKPSLKRNAPDYWPRSAIALGGFKRRKRQLGGEWDIPCSLPPTSHSVVAPGHFLDVTGGFGDGQTVEFPGAAVNVQKIADSDHSNTHHQATDQAEQPQGNFQAPSATAAEQEPEEDVPNFESTSNDIRAPSAPLPDTDCPVRSSTSLESPHANDDRLSQEHTQDPYLTEAQHLRSDDSCIIIEKLCSQAPVQGVETSPEQSLKRVPPVGVTKPDIQIQDQLTSPDETYFSRIDYTLAADAHSPPTWAKQPRPPVSPRPDQALKAQLVATQARSKAADTASTSLPDKARQSDPVDLKRLAKFVQGLSNDHGSFRNTLSKIERSLADLAGQPKVVPQATEPGIGRLVEQLTEEFRQFKAEVAAQNIPDDNQSDVVSVVSGVESGNGAENLSEDIKTFVETKFQSVQATIGADLQDGMKHMSSRLDKVVKQLNLVREQRTPKPCEHASTENVLLQSKLENASTRLHDISEVLKGHASTFHNAVPSASIMKELIELLRAQILAQPCHNSSPGPDFGLKEKITNKEQEIKELEGKLAVLAQSEEQLRTQSAKKLEQGLETERAKLIAVTEASSKEFLANQESLLSELANTTEERNRLRKDVELYNQQLNETCAQLEQLRERSAESDANEQKLQAMTQNCIQLQETLSNYETNRAEDAERICELQGLLGRILDSHSVRKQNMETAFEEHARRNEQQVGSLQAQVAEQQKELEKLRSQLSHPLAGPVEQSEEFASGDGALNANPEASRDHSKERRLANRKYYGLTQMTSPGPRRGTTDAKDGPLLSVQAGTVVRSQESSKSAPLVSNSQALSSQSALTTPHIVKTTSGPDHWHGQPLRKESLVVQSSQNLIQATPSTSHVRGPFTPYKPKPTKELETAVRARHAFQATPSRCSQGNVPNSSSKRAPTGSRPYTPGLFSDTQLSQVGGSSSPDPLHSQVSKCVFKHGLPRTSNGGLSRSTLVPNTPQEAPQPTSSQPVAQKFTVSDLPTGLATAKGKTKSQSWTSERPTRNVTFGKVTQSQ